MQMQKTNWWLPVGREERRAETGIGNEESQTTTCKVNQLHGCIIQPRDYSQYFIMNKWSITFKNCESLCCTPETMYIVVVQLLGPVHLFLQPHGLWPTRLICPQDFPGKNTGVGCYFFFHRIFPTQELNLHLLHCR